MSLGSDDAGEARDAEERLLIQRRNRLRRRVRAGSWIPLETISVFLR